MDKNMNDSQWKELSERFNKLDGKIENLTGAITELHVGVAILGNELGVTVFGKEAGKPTGNGMKEDIKKNAKAIEDLKTAPAKKRKIWIPILIAAIATTWSILQPFVLKLIP